MRFMDAIAHLLSLLVTDGLRVVLLRKQVEVFAESSILNMTYVAVVKYK